MTEKNKKINKNNNSFKISPEKNDGYPEDQKGAQRGKSGGEQGGEQGVADHIHKKRDN